MKAVDPKSTAGFNLASIFAIYARKRVCNMAAWEQITRDWFLFKINILTLGRPHQAHFSPWKSTF